MEKHVPKHQPDYNISKCLIPASFLKHLMTPIGTMTHPASPVGNAANPPFYARCDAPGTLALAQTQASNQQKQAVKNQKLRILLPTIHNNNICNQIINDDFSLSQYAQLSLLYQILLLYDFSLRGRKVYSWICCDLRYGNRMLMQCISTWQNRFSQQTEVYWDFPDKNLWFTPW